MADVLLHFEDEAVLAERIATAAGLDCAPIARHRFPDGETRLRLLPALPARAVLLRSLHWPNDKLVELMLAAGGARALGVRDLTLVAPYLAYMRQDIAFTPGEVVSQRVVGRFLAGLFDGVITVDPHLHRVATLAEAVPTQRALVLSGAPLLADLVARARPGALLVAPDDEARQWVAAAADRCGLDFLVCEKRRHGDREVRVQLPEAAYVGRTVVLIDDVISTGHTIADAARQLVAAGAASVDVAVTHALFAPGAIELLHDAGVGKVWSTDCIPHASNAVSVADSVAALLRA